MYFRKESTVSLTPLLLYIAFAAANNTESYAVENKTESPCPNCINFDGQCHTITHILNLNNDFRERVVITQLGVLNEANTLYYAFEPNISDPEYYKVGYANLVSESTQGVLKADTEKPNFRTFHFDQKNKTIYLGGSNGIYTSNQGGPATFFSSMHDTIVSIYFKTNVYFLREGQNTLVQKHENLFNTFDNYVNLKKFVIDKNDMIVYLNTSGLYANRLAESSTNNAMYLSKNAFFRGLTTDRDGDSVYAWWIDGIYKVVKEDARVVKVADIPNIGAVTFDKNNDVVFSIEKGLYRLVRNDKEC